MSHISRIELEVKDLGILGQACIALELQLIKNQKTFRWYGKDARCDHAIQVPGADYEIGVIRKEHSYELSCDFHDHHLEKIIGAKGGLLKQAYAVTKTKIEARRKGYSVMEKKAEQSIRLHVRIS